jgi:hypothetical protein
MTLNIIIDATIAYHMYVLKMINITTLRLHFTHQEMSRGHSYDGTKSAYSTGRGKCNVIHLCIHRGPVNSRLQANSGAIHESKPGLAHAMFGMESGGGARVSTPVTSLHESHDPIPPATAGAGAGNERCGETIRVMT